MSEFLQSSLCKVNGDAVHMASSLVSLPVRRSGALLLYEAYA